MYYHANNPAVGARSPSAPVSEKRFIKMGHACLGVSEGRSLTLTGADRHDSLLWSRQTDKPTGTVHKWSPYGSGKPAAASLPGFNGERIDPVSGSYHLGNGYRAYNPVLMRFNCPDSLSPFGAGGINPYAYCAGDPVNHTDPSGHLSWQAILGIALGALGLAAAIFTGGMSIVAAGGVAAALSSASTTALVIGGLGVVADVTAIVSGAVEESAPSASSVLGWVSLATGLVGAAIGLAGLGKSIKNLVKGRGSYDLTKAAEAADTVYEAGVFRKNVFRTPAYFDRNATFTPFGALVESSPTGERHILDAMGYINNFRETGEPALMVHGSKTGLGFYDGVVDISSASIPKTFINMEDFTNYINRSYKIDLSANKGKKLHLIACNAGGETGTAQRLANNLKRPVVGYGKEGTIIKSADIHEIAYASAHIIHGGARRHSLEELKAIIYYPRNIEI